MPRPGDGCPFLPALGYGLGRAAIEEPCRILARSVAGSPGSDGAAGGEAVTGGDRALHVPERFRAGGLLRARKRTMKAHGKTTEERIIAKHQEALHRGFLAWSSLAYDRPPAMGDARWTADLILATWTQAETGRPPTNGLEYKVGQSGGGFDALTFKFLPGERWLPEQEAIDTSIPLNRRPYDRNIQIPLPWYGAGMSYGSISEQIMLARAKAARQWGTFTSSGEGGYPESLVPYRKHVITQVATGMFGVREETILWAPIVEFKYAQGAKPGLGGHLLGDKTMVAVGSYYAGAHIIQIDGAYGGTGAAPEIAKKNIAMPIELAIPKVHRFLVQEGIREEVVLMASGGIRTADDIAKAIALGADGCILGTTELVALGCTRCSNCERGRGCPFGLTTTDPQLSQLVDPDWGAERISHLYASFQLQLRAILRRLGLRSVQELRGRRDLLIYRKEGHHEPAATH